MHTLHSTTSICLLLLTVLLWLSPGTSAYAECGECDRMAMCAPAPTDCPGEQALDECDCCLVCAKVENQTCQGPFGQFGRCADDLVCVTQPRPGEPISPHDEGICKPKGQPPLPEHCDSAKCQVVFVPQCPPDAKVVKNAPPAGQCCPEPPTCQCLDCANLDPVCPDGHLKVKAVEGQGVPGQCCDIFKCEPREIVCGEAVCPEDRFANTSCPEDSHKLPPMLTHNGCCQQHPLPGCECHHLFECQPVVCAGTESPEQLHRATGLPGDCCDIWECINATSTACLHNGKEYEDGESWIIDSCTRMTCTQGILFLEDLSLDCETPTDCGLLRKPEGECCLVCKGCVDASGKWYENGSSWQQDDCLTCRCEGGQIHCVVEDCFINCQYPRKVPDQCCPVCPGNESISATPHCPTLRGCHLRCALGYVVDQFGCDVCQCKIDEVISDCDKHCALGYQVNDEGETICACIPGQDQCPSLSNCTRTDCIFGYRRDTRGCPKCKCRKCPELRCNKKCPDGFVYNNDCKQCTCKGTAEASPTTAPALKPPRGRVCLSTAGHMMQEGQPWHDGCRRCFCHQGREMCALLSCRAPTCRNPFIKQGDCCPSCGSVESYPIATTSCTTLDGQRLREGQSLELDKCTLCICHDGGMLCEVESCPPILCHQPYYKDKDSCCPVCPEEGTMIPAGLPIGDISHKTCISNSGFVYEHRDTWKVSPCQSCVCRDGQIHCFAQTCQVLQCERTTLVKGHCCPVCIESTTRLKPHCLHNGESYVEKERWLIDDCIICVCLDGQKMCTEEICGEIPPDCSHAVTLPGLCCPICTNSTQAPSPSDVTDSPGYRTHGHTMYHALIAVLASVSVILTILVAMLIVWFCCCPHWRGSAGLRDCNNSKISHFTQTSGDVKRRQKSTVNGDIKLTESFITDSSLQGITNTQMNEYTVLPGVLNSNVNEYSTIPALPPPLNDYATLNGLHMHINEYTPLTRDETDKAPSQERMWRYSSAEDKAGKIYLDIPDICDTAGNRKSL